LGGDKTLASYGIDASEGRRLYEVQREAFDAIPLAQIAFLRALPLTFQHAHWFFVHAGIRPNISLSEQLEDDLLWIREPFLSYQDRHPFMVVHGHTALDAPAHFGNRINLDGGAGYGRPLVPVALNKETMRSLC
jgi:serine/threonine protein phosphatase 1